MSIRVKLQVNDEINLPQEFIQIYLRRFKAFENPGCDVSEIDNLKIISGIQLWFG
jgi:hypothetical protein